MTAETIQVAVVSTSHVSQSCMEELCSDPTMALSGQYAAQIWVGHPGDGALHNLGVLSESCPEIINVISWAHRNDFSYVMFDCDAGAIPDLATFDW